MTEKQADLPDKYILGDSWGLGWIRFGWDGRRLIGHDGNTIGQAAFLRLLPDAGLAVTLLTNGGNTRDLYEDLYREIFAELAERRRCRGRWSRRRSRCRSTSRRTSARTSGRACGSTCCERDGGPMLRTTVTGPLAELVPEPVHEYPMVAVERGPVRRPRAGDADLDAGDVLLAADRRGVHALRGAGDAEGRLMTCPIVGRTPMARRLCLSRRTMPGRRRGRIDVVVPARRRRSTGASRAACASA